MVDGQVVSADAQAYFGTAALNVTTPRRREVSSSPLLGFELAVSANGAQVETTLSAAQETQGTTRRR